MNGFKKATIEDTEGSTELQTSALDDEKKSEPPKLFAWIASLLVVLLIVLTQFLARGDDPYLRGAGVFTLILAAIFMFTPFLLLSRYGRTENNGNYMQTTVVVERGLYAITRHPQYLGYMFLAAGFSLLSQHWMAFLLGAAGITAFYLQVVQEEQYCLARLGESYARYLGRVPRFNFLLGIIRLLQKSNVREKH